MLSCKQIVRSASDYTDGNLNWRGRLNTKMHLLMCGRCTRFMRHFKISIVVCAKIAPKEVSTEDIDSVVNLVK